MSFKVKARIFVFLLGLNLTTLAGCMKETGTVAGPSQSPKLESEHEQLQLSNMEKYRPKLEKVPMDTKVPLRALLHQFNQYGHEQKLIRKDLIQSVFGGIMNENTPYEKILTYHPSTFEEENSSEQKMCDKLNEHRKHSQHMKRLTLESPVDLKPFALEIEKGWKELQLKFPKELGNIQLNLFCIDEHRPDVNSSFDYVSIVQSCQFVRFCIFHHGELYEMDKNRFEWVNEGLFLLKLVFSQIYDDKFYRYARQYAEKSIREHPICATWNHILNSHLERVDMWNFGY